MQQQLHKLSLMAIVSGSEGVGIFLHGASRTFLIQVDPYQGQLLEWYHQGVKHHRPLTHDLLNSLVHSIGGSLERVIIHDVQEEVYFAQMRIHCQDNLERHLIMDLDCRPSDGIALALLQEAPIYATQKLLDTIEDCSALLEEIQKNQIEEIFNPNLINYLEEDESGLGDFFNPFDEKEDDDDNEGDEENAS